MIQNRKYIASLILAGCFSTLVAQEATVQVRDREVRRMGDELQVEMRFVLDSLTIARGESLVCTPVVESGDSGMPVVLKYPYSASAKAFKTIVDKVVKTVE